MKKRKETKGRMGVRATVHAEKVRVVKRENGKKRQERGDTNNYACMGKSKIAAKKGIECSKMRVNEPASAQERQSMQDYVSLN